MLKLLIGSILKPEVRVYIPADPGVIPEELGHFCSACIVDADGVYKPCAEAHRYIQFVFTMGGTAPAMKEG